MDSINADGSHKMLHPADVRGTFTLGRRIAAAVLMIVYVSLPWIKIRGYPAVFLDATQGRFHFFGLTLVTQDLWLAFFLVTGLAFGLFYVSSFLGRIWCGWTCPYTVFLEHVFRRVERWIDGDATARRRLEAQPWNGMKIARRILKHSIYLILSLIIAHIFLSYFVSIPQLYVWMREAPIKHAFAFCTVIFLTGALYFAFGWFREQFCVILCPYGRLQSALTDDHTLVIGYDKNRGEPRGKKGTPGAGDCVDCLRCVHVCPTGIDIRNGLQLECIGCAACVDACDEVMVKVGRKKGLVRYGSMVSLAGGKTRFFRPRTIVYTIFAFLGLTALTLALSTLSPVRVMVKRIQGQPYFVTENEIRNQFNIHIINKRQQAGHYQIALLPSPELPGARMAGAAGGVEAPPLGEIDATVIVTVPKGEYKGSKPIRFVVTETSGSAKAEQEVEFLGPDLRFFQVSNSPPLNQ
jgi:cytochrome c oxidase accessory protein FixG